jgi:circadian clock protein KaiC
MSMKLKSAQSLRCSTGIEGLDDILCGGLPRNRTYLIQGDPGVGKTTLAMQFLLEGIRRGERGLYITLSETKEELQAVADSHGWSLDKIHLFELSAIEDHLLRDTDNTFFHPSEVELNRTAKALLDEVTRIKPMRVVFDSLSEMRMLAETPLRYRRQILQLKQYFAGLKCTVLLLDDRSSGARDLQIESIAHGVISLHRSTPDYGIAQRQLNIQKVRGVKFREGNHDYIIKKGGLEIFTRLVAAEHHVAFKRESFPSGIKELDALLGGGLDRGTSNMFMGPPGTGKSTMAMKFALTAARRKEKVLFFVFDETIGTLMNRALKLGMDVRPFIKDGTITVEQVDPAEISPGELTSRIRKAVQLDQTRMVIIDSLNGYLNAMPAEKYLNLQLHELFAYLNQMGVITITVLAQQGLVGTMQSTVELTYLADTVILLRYFEARGVVKQALSVIKKRSGNHERSIRELVIDKSGIRLSQPLTGMQGILMGTPNFLDSNQESNGKSGLVQEAGGRS